MITNQESPQTDFRPPRSAYYNIPKNAAATDYDKPLEIYNHRSKLVFIERSLTRLPEILQDSLTACRAKL